MSNDTFNPFSTSNLLDDLNALATPKSRASRASAVATHDHVLTTRDLADSALLLNPTATALINACTALTKRLKSDPDAMQPITPNVAVSVQPKTFTLHIRTASAHAPKRASFDLATRLLDTDKLAPVSTTRHFRHAKHGLVTICDVAQLLSCFASYLPTDCDASVVFARSAIADTIRADHTHYSAVHLAHLTASALVSLHDDATVYAPCFNAVLVALDSDSPHFINCDDADAYPATVHNALASVINRS